MTVVYHLSADDLRFDVYTSNVPTPTSCVYPSALPKGCCSRNIEVPSWDAEHVRSSARPLTFETAFGSSPVEGGWSYKFSGSGPPPPPVGFPSGANRFPPSLSPLTISLGAGG
jgi:hypothetical protein